MIFLIGYMGSGKTTVGRKLAKKLNLPFYDLDKLIVSRENDTISGIFSSKGEDYFRITERQTLFSLDLNEPAIISTGGGTPCYMDNMAWMNNNGITVYLEMTPKALFSRLKGSGNDRPLLKGHTNLPEYIENHLNERKFYYKMSRITVNGLSVNIDHLAEEIQSLLLA